MNGTQLAWFKSSYSGMAGDNCVEVAFTEQTFRVKGSKEVMRRPFTMSRNGWSQFVAFLGDD
ncbi:DUF397 domain-containing protein [Streptomyces labedae]|uniref:DUF397 domain-containing protein n=1 Tax=Streptomyces labedae TaxID=285569 RepID=A0ABP6QR65_9ACTN|nr:DUF397 domain-containing protein [Streptomyces vinaceus]